MLGKARGSTGISMQISKKKTERGEKKRDAYD